MGLLSKWVNCMQFDYTGGCCFGHFIFETDSYELIFSENLNNSIDLYEQSLFRLPYESKRL